MSYRKKIVMVVILLVIPVVALFIPAFSSFSICEYPEGYLCERIFFNEPLRFSFLLLGSVAISLIFLLPFSQRVFSQWKKFARIAIPLLFIWFILTPQDGGCHWLYPCYDKALVAFVGGGMYLLLSIIFTIIYGIRRP